MGAPDPATLPPWAQLTLFIVFGLASLGWVIKVWFTTKPPTPEEAHRQASDMMLTAGTIADMKPVRDAAHSLKELVNLAREIMEMMRERRTEDEIERRAEDMAERLAEKIIAERDRRNR